MKLLQLYPRRISIALFAFSLLSIFFFINSGAASAFYVVGAKWVTYNASYKVDSSFSNTNSGWNNTLNVAITDWNNHGTSPFYFYNSSSSFNEIKAGPYCTSFALGCTDRNINQDNNIVQMTVYINTGQDFAFFDGTQNGGVLPSNYYDLATLMRHELGHGLGLCHGDSGTLMYAYQNPGQTRFIDTDAKNGAAWMYSSYHPVAPQANSCS